MSIELEGIVKDAYQKRGYNSVNVIGDRALSAREQLVVVQYKDEDDDECEEVCVVTDGVVRIFDGNIHLIHQIDRPNRLLDWVMSGHGISAIAFFVTLGALIAFGANGLSTDPSFDVLKQVCLLAAGFFLGNQARVQTR